MFVWTMTILYLGGRLERAAERLDGKISAAALDPFADTAAQYDKIACLIDRKRRLANMQVLSHRLRCGLDESDLRLARLCLSGMSYAEIGAETGVSKATAYRRVKRMTAASARILEGLGFDAERLASDYADVEPVRRAYRHFKRGQADEREQLTARRCAAGITRRKVRVCEACVPWAQGER